MVSAVATELHCVELSSGKSDALIRHFQPAAFSVGSDVDAIKHERSSPRFIRFNSKSQRDAKAAHSTSFIRQQQLAKQARMVGASK